LCLLSFSGLGCAILLRYLEYNGSIIAVLGIITEMISMIICYFIFLNYFNPKKESEKPEIKKKKK